MLETVKTLLAKIASAINPLTGGMDVNIQDQTTPPIALHFSKALGAPTTIAVDVNADGTNRTITIADNTNFVDGTWVGVFSGVSGEKRYYFAEQKGAAVANGPNWDITLDTPLDFPYIIGDPVLPQTRDMNVDGSITHQIFSVQAGQSGLEIDITRLMWAMVLDSAGDDGLYGNIDELALGCVLRRTDGDIRNYFNVKSNGEIANLAYDVTYAPRSGGGGSHGMRAKYTWAGQNKNGVTVRLGPNESLDYIIQDDLTGIAQHRLLVGGHETDE